MAEKSYSIGSAVSMSGKSGAFKDYIDGTLTEVKAADYNGSKQIGNYMFYQNSNLKKLEIPDSVESIGNSSIVSTGITELTIPSSVKRIGAGSIKSNPSLANVIIKGELDSVSTGCFTSLNSNAYLIDNNAKYIGNINNPHHILVSSNIRGSSSPTEIIVSKDAELAVGGTFSDYSTYNYLTKLTFEEGSKLKVIPEQFLYNCKKLTEITIPESVETIYDKAFQNCNGLTEVVFKNNKPMLIGTGGSSGFLPTGSSNKITKIKIKNIISLFESDFKDKIHHLNQNLKASFYDLNDNVLDISIIPDGCKRIGENVISKYNLIGDVSSIIIPDSVENISKSVFSKGSEMSSLTSLTLPFTGITENISSSVTAGFFTSIFCNISPGKGYTKVSQYMGRDSYNKVDMYIPTNLKNITITKKLSEYCFAGLSNLNLTISDTITEIPTGSFCRSSNLTNYNLLLENNKITKIGYDAYYKTDIDKVYLYNYITAIGVEAFSETPNLEYIFYDVPNLEAIISTTNQRFQNSGSALTGKSKRCTIEIGEHVETIPPHLFYNKKNALTSVTFTNNSKCTTIGPSAFENANLDTLVLPVSIVKIDSRAFRENANLLNITFLGTKSQWKNIEKPGLWYPIDSCVIHCNDGNLDVSGKDI